MVLRSTLIAIAQANSTGEYSVFLALMDPASAPSRKEALADLFRPWREAQRDIGFAAIAEPELRRPPSIDAEGVLQLAGVVPTPAFVLDFDLGFAWVSGRWRLARFRLSDGALIVASTSLTPVAATEQRPEPPVEAMQPKTASGRGSSSGAPPLPPDRPAF